MSRPELKLSLQFADARNRDHLPRHRVARWIRVALERSGEMTVRIVDADEGRALNREYRAKDEEREWMTNHDPLLTLAGRLTGQHLADASVFERIESDVKAEIDSGVQFALAAPYPALSQVDEDVYA